MKQFLKRLISSLLLASMLLPLLVSLTSCSEGARLNRMEESERAVEFMKVLDKNMNSQGSYTNVMEMDMVFEVYGLEVSIKGNGTMMVCGNGAEDYFSYTETHNVMTMDGESTEITVIEGYTDGKMFSSRAEEGQKTIKLWSPITAEEYVAYQLEQTSSISMNDEDMTKTAATRTCVQNADKTWTATYTDYDAQGLKLYNHLLDGMDYMMNDVFVSDVILTVHANQELYPTTMAIEFVFERTENADEEILLPLISITATYQDIGKTTPIEVDLTRYAEVADLRVATIVENSLQEFLEADKADFRVNISQRATYKGQIEGYAESDEGHFETTSEGYTFDIQCESNGVKFSVGYRDGIRWVKDEKGKPAGEDVFTDAEAKAFIKSLLDPASFSASMVTDIEKDDVLSKNGKSVYHLTLQTPDLTSYEEMLGVNRLSGECKTKVTIEEGRMTQQAFTLTMTASSGLEFVVTYKCYYDSFSNSEANVNGEAVGM